MGLLSWPIPHQLWKESKWELGIADKSTTYTRRKYNQLLRRKWQAPIYCIDWKQSQKQTWNDSYLQGNDFPDDTAVKTSMQPIPLPVLNRSEWALASYFGRATYNYDSNYIFSASVRRYGSSKLAHHWGNARCFFRMGHRHWNFFKDISAIRDLKVRVGWGETVTRKASPTIPGMVWSIIIAAHQHHPLSGPSAAQVSYGNRISNGETTDQTNVGIDLLNVSAAETLLSQRMPYLKNQGMYY